MGSGAAVPTAFGLAQNLAEQWIDVAQGLAGRTFTVQRIYLNS